MPVGAQAGQPGAGRRRGADAAADDGRVVEVVGHVGMDVAGAEGDDRLRGGDLDALAGGRRPTGALRHEAEDGRLVEPELAVARADAEHDLLGRDGVAVVQRLDHGLVRIGALERMGEQDLGLVDAAQHGVLAGEDLHRHERVEALALGGSPRRARSRRRPTRRTGSPSTGAAVA